METETHLIIKKFLKDYHYTDSTTFHVMYDDFEQKRLIPSFKHFVRVLKEMGIKSKSFRVGDKVIRRFYYDSLADTYLGRLHKLITCEACSGTGVIQIKS